MFFSTCARAHPPLLLQVQQGRHRNTCSTDTQEHTHTHTFPGGDESCQQLAEVGSGVCILLSRRESFQLGGRAAVLEVVLSQGVGISLEES